MVKSKTKQKVLPSFKNKKAFHDLEIMRTLECGIVLLGTEVKAIRQGGGHITESYIRLKGSEVYIVGWHIPPYQFGTHLNHEPTRWRKLLLHKKEIQHLMSDLNVKQLICVPVEVYFKNGKIKLKIGVGRGKKHFDKRESIKKRDSERKIAQIKKHYQ